MKDRRNFILRVGYWLGGRDLHADAKGQAFKGGIFGESHEIHEDTVV